MEKKIYLIFFYQCIFITMLVCYLKLCCGISWRKFEGDTFYTGKTCDPSDILFQEDNIHAVTCGKLCDKNKGCIYTVYQRNIRQCIGCNYRPYVARKGTHTDEGQTPIHFKNKDTKFDCTDILEANPSAPSGVYKVANSMKVYCDMMTDGGGWTVTHRRFDGSVDFNRNFSEYENGFGDVNGEFWMGLRNMLKIIKIPNEFRLHLVEEENSDTTGYDLETTQTGYDFQLLEGKNYSISVSDPTGAGNIFLYFPSVVTPFSTFDRDMDSETSVNCAAAGAFWHTVCTGFPLPANLNGKFCYPENGCDEQPILFLPTHFHARVSGMLKESSMMIRRNKTSV